ncbi:filamentous hemagglutinin family N-terminal domain [Beggiatoa alba B18LD]|uniref:Filamentous hemagglutinin family N-terminal domain n=1 Tax=Beggiatoa alba B18LD TaxID=395493 RepID=I3CDC5_9GAMM|nr:filamentous hemagglutinin N-terminal domain-containing protein [Beggiatoa alba]EIJ41618.1 filamentous hemagglutinin family N-terminal domain [Beggiatoa alba B18LD]
MHSPSRFRLILLYSLFFWTISSVAEVIVDGSLGQQTGLNAPNYQISAVLGQQQGTNLFHSFSQFNLQPHETAVFLGSADIQQVISRVTGGNASVIDGRITTNMANASFYFLNPAGVIFGEHAVLNVPNSFYISTADYLQFTDQQVFFTHLSQNSRLTTASPLAFGFLSATPAPITVDNGLLSVRAGKTLGLVGGDIFLNNSTLFATGGQLVFIATKAVGTVGLGINAQERVEHWGTVQITRSTGQIRPTLSNGVGLGDVDVSGTQSGQIYIRAGQFIASNAYLFADTYGNGTQASGVSIIADESMQLSQQSRITADKFGTGGRGGDIQLTSADLTLVDPDTIVRARLQRNSSGQAGNIVIQAERVQLHNGAGIGSVTAGDGNSGNIEITASEFIDIQQQSGISASSESTSTGSAGNLLIDAPLIQLNEQGAILSLARGTGGSGIIQIHANTLQLDNQSGISVALGEQADGVAGTIQVEVAELVINQGSFIDSSTLSAGQGGTIRINASDFVLIQTETGDKLSLISSSAGQSGVLNRGNGGAIEINSPYLQILQGGRIQSATFVGSTGQAGSIVIQAERILLSKGGDIIAPSSGTGHGGEIAVTAHTINLEKNSKISVQSTSTGNAGNIQIRADVLQLTDNSVITTEARTAGGGNIYLEINQSLYLLNSQITAEATGTKSTDQGGNLNIGLRHSPHFMILNQGTLRANAFAGHGGNIQIIAGNFIASSDSLLDASSALGIDGTIQIRAPETQLLGDIALLPSHYLNASLSLQTACQLVINDVENSSSFTVLPTQGVPLSPNTIRPTPITH